jgi:hypothetical protein
MAPNLYASNVGGTASGLQTISKIKCKNKTTGQVVKISPGNYGTWDCEQAGLIVNTDDVIKIELKGTAQGAVPDRPQAGMALGGTSMIYLEWDIVIGANSYSVYREIQPATVPAVWMKIADVKANEYMDTMIDPNLNYRYVITAVNDAGESNHGDVILGKADPAGMDHITLSTDCALSGCHDNVTLSGKGGSHIFSDNMCEACHNPVAWIPAALDHTHVSGVCSSCHNGIIASGKGPNHIPNTNECDVCHQVTSWVLVNIDHTRLSDTCFNCHNGIDARGKSPLHPVTPDNCEQCHVASNWLTILSPPIVP